VQPRVSRPNENGRPVRAALNRTLPTPTANALAETPEREQSDVTSPAVVVRAATRGNIHESHTNLTAAPHTELTPHTQRSAESCPYRATVSRGRPDLAFHARLMELALQAANTQGPFLMSRTNCPHGGGGWCVEWWRIAWCVVRRGRVAGGRRCPIPRNFVCPLLRFRPVRPAPPARGATPGQPPHENRRPVRAALNRSLQPPTANALVETPEREHSDGASPAVFVRAVTRGNIEESPTHQPNRSAAHRAHTEYAAIC
jgi:hypothetical protein